MKRRFKKLGIWETVGIITSDFNLAESFFEVIYKRHKRKVVKFTKSKCNLYILLKNGTRYMWIRPTDNSRGYRFSKVYLDHNIDYRLLQEVILPCCVYAKPKDIMDLNGKKYPRI